MLAEVRGLSTEDAKRLGLTLVTPSLEMVDAAVRAASIRLSWQDILCSDLASQEGWTCVTNDTGLHERCKTLSINSKK